MSFMESNHLDLHWISTHYINVSHCILILGCYGVAPAIVTKEWKCARCKANAMTEVSKFTVG